jgi:hypothetical protein
MNQQGNGPFLSHGTLKPSIDTIAGAAERKFWTSSYSEFPYPSHHFPD